MNQKHLIIYTSQNCPYSKRLKSFLYQNGIPFEEINASKSPKEAILLQQIDENLRTPIIKIPKEGKYQIFIGWNEENKERVIKDLNSVT